jgi:hypothetical protein
MPLEHTTDPRGNGSSGQSADGERPAGGSDGRLDGEDVVYHGRYPHRGFFESVSDEDERAVDRAVEDEREAPSGGRRD